MFVYVPESSQKFMFHTFVPLHCSSDAFFTVICTYFPWLVVMQFILPDLNILNSLIHLLNFHLALSFGWGSLSLKQELVCEQHFHRFTDSKTFILGLCVKVWLFPETSQSIITYYLPVPTVYPVTSTKWHFVTVYTLIHHLSIRRHSLQHMN